MGKRTAFVALGVASVLGMTGVASAGEVKPADPKGTGDYSTPIAGWPAEHRNSICAFSGLQDFDNLQPPQPGVTQTPAGSRGAARECSEVNYGKLK